MPELGLDRFETLVVYGICTGSCLIMEASLIVGYILWKHRENVNFRSSITELSQSTEVPKRRVTIDQERSE